MATTENPFKQATIFFLNVRPGLYQTFFFIFGSCFLVTFTYSAVLVPAYNAAVPPFVEWWNTLNKPTNTYTTTPTYNTPSAVQKPAKRKASPNRAGNKRATTKKSTKGTTTADRRRRQAASAPTPIPTVPHQRESRIRAQKEEEAKRRAFQEYNRKRIEERSRKGTVGTVPPRDKKGGN